MSTKEFNQIYLKNKPELFRYINWKVKNKENAEDILEMVFTKAHRLIFTNDIRYKFNPEKSNIKTWLITVANCAMIDYWRLNHEYQYHNENVSDFVNIETGEETFQFVASRTENADFNIENLELKNRISKAFETLKPKYKKIAILYFQDNESYDNIAEICNVPTGTVKGTINRIREKLQNQLKSVREMI